MIYQEIIENEDVIDISLEKENKRAKRRKKDFSKAIRKKKLSEQIHSPVEKDGICKKNGMYKNLHQYNKGRVRCGCPLCTGKYGGRHKHTKYISSKGMYSYSHKKKLDAANKQIKMYTNG